MGDCGTCGKMLQAEEASPAAAQSTEGEWRVCRVAEAQVKSISSVSQSH